MSMSSRGLDAFLAANPNPNPTRLGPNSFSRDSSSLAHQVKRDQSKQRKKRQREQEQRNNDGDGEEEDEEDYLEAGTAALDDDDDDDDDDGDDDDDEDDGDDEGDAVNRNVRERRRVEGGRNWEKIHSDRLKEQGINVADEGNEEEGNQQPSVSNLSSRAFTSKSGRLRLDGIDPGSESHAAKLRKLFDKKPEDKFESFSNDTGGQRNRSRGGGASSSVVDSYRVIDEEEEEKRREEADPWIKQVNESKADPTAAEPIKLEPHVIRPPAPSSPPLALSVDEARRRIVSFLLPGEDVLTALRRLGASNNSHQSATVAARNAAQAFQLAQRAKQKNQRKNTPAQTQTQTPSNPSTHSPNPNAQAFSLLTSLASHCLDSGDVAIYEETKESLQRKLAITATQPSSQSQISSSNPPLSLSLSAPSPLQPQQQPLPLPHSKPPAVSAEMIPAQKKEVRFDSASETAERTAKREEEEEEEEDGEWVYKTESSGSRVQGPVSFAHLLRVRAKLAGSHGKLDLVCRRVGETDWRPVPEHEPAAGA